MSSRQTAATRRRHPAFYLAELVRALAVILLVSLNFGHSQSFAMPVDAGVSESGGLSRCGDGDAPGALHELPCHACRIGGAADLPPPALDALPVRLSLALAFGPALQPAGALAAPGRSHRPRGPPVAV